MKGTTEIQEKNIHIKRAKTSAAEAARLGVALAILEVSKIALDFIPNVELVTLLFIVYTLSFGRKTLWIAIGFVAVECFMKGISMWVLMYLYIWPLLILLVCFMKKRGAGYLLYCVLSGIFGLLFGLLCTPPNFLIAGVKTAIAWWISGIPYDIVHGISNFIICLVLLKPLHAALQKCI